MDVVAVDVATVYVAAVAVATVDVAAVDVDNMHVASVDVADALLSCSSNIGPFSLSSSVAEINSWTREARLSAV